MFFRRNYHKCGVFSWIETKQNEFGLVVTDAARQIDLSNVEGSASFDFISFASITQFKCPPYITANRSFNANMK